MTINIQKIKEYFKKPKGDPLHARLHPQRDWHVLLFVCAVFAAIFLTWFVFWFVTLLSDENIYEVKHDVNTVETINRTQLNDVLRKYEEKEIRHAQIKENEIDAGLDPSQ